MALIVLRMQIESRRLDRRVPQVLLDESDVGAGVGLVRSRGVAQPVGPDTVHGDTHAQSAPVFALAHLLGINLMPNIRDVKDLVFYRADRRRRYKNIESLFRASIDWALIERHFFANAEIFADHVGRAVAGSRSRVTCGAICAAPTRLEAVELA